MGTVVNYDAVEAQPLSEGVSVAALVEKDGKEMGPRTFAIVQEATPFAVSGGRAAARVLSVVVPPPGVSRAPTGFSGGLKVMAVTATCASSSTARRRRSGPGRPCTFPPTTAMACRAPTARS